MAEENMPAVWSRIDGLRGKIDAMNGRIDSLFGRIDAMTEKANRNDNEIIRAMSTLREDFKVFRDLLDRVDPFELKLKLTALESRIAVAEAKVDGMELALERTSGRRFAIVQTLLPWLLTVILGAVSAALASGWRPN